MGEQREDERIGRKAAEGALKESETNYRALIDDLPELICRSAPDLTRLYVNEGYCRYFGKSREELIGRSFLELLPEEDHEPLKEHLASLSREDPVGTFEHRVLRRDGEIRWQQWTNRAIFDEDGAFLGYQAMGRDFNVRKLAEEALKESEERFRSLADASFEGLAICNEEGTVEEANLAFAEMFGYELSEVRGMPALEFHVSEHREAVWQKISSGSGEEPYESEGLRKDGTTFEVEFRGRVASRGDSTVLISALRDVGERKRAEGALRRSEATLAEAQRLARLGSWEWDVKTGEVVWSDEVYRLCGFAPRAFAPSFEGFLEAVHPDDKELLWDKVGAALREGEPYDLEHRLVLPDGEVRVTHCRGEVAFDGRRAAADGGHRPRHHGAQEGRGGSQGERRAVPRPDRRGPLEGILITTEGGRILEANRAYAEMFGYDLSEMVGKPVLDFIAPGSVEVVLGNTRRGFEEPYEVEAYKKDGSRLYVEIHGRPAAYRGRDIRVAAVRNITGRKEAEEALKESEERHRAVVEQSAEAIWLFDPDTKEVLESNTAFQELLGYSGEELRDLTNYDFVAHSDEEVDRTVARKVRKGKTFPSERQYRRKDGTLIDVEVNGTTISYRGKEVVCSVARDVTERKRAEEALRQSERRFSEAQRGGAVREPTQAVARSGDPLREAGRELPGDGGHRRPRDLADGVNHQTGPSRGRSSGG